MDNIEHKLNRIEDNILNRVKEYHENETEILRSIDSSLLSIDASLKHMHSEQHVESIAQKDDMLIGWGKKLFYLSAIALIIKVFAVQFGAIAPAFGLLG